MATRLSLGRDKLGLQLTRTTIDQLLLHHSVVIFLARWREFLAKVLAQGELLVGLLDVGHALARTRRKVIISHDWAGVNCAVLGRQALLLRISLRGGVYLLLIRKHLAC